MRSCRWHPKPVAKDRRGLRRHSLAPRGGTDDAEEKRYFRNPTTIFAPSDEPVDRLREMAGRLLRQSHVYQRLLRDLGSAPSPE